MNEISDERIKSLIPNCPSETEFHDCLENPVELYGTRMENGAFSKELVRLPKECASSGAIEHLRKITTGVRVRFETDSPYIAILGKTEGISAFNQCYGFDIRVTYADGYVHSFHATRNDYRYDYPSKSDDECITYFERTASLYCGRYARLFSGTKQIEIMFPHYCGTKWLKIGIANGSRLSSPQPYRIEKPVVFFGSSITQGIRASRPATTYEAQISHILDCNYINLGLSGNCKAQPEIGDYIKTLDMSAFVYDYDHNAPDVDFLKATHEDFFLAIRNEHKNLPVVFISKPDVLCNEFDSAKRRGVIYTTYSNALGRGDRNVYFIDGESLFAYEGVDRSICTYDGCHPNDLGFFCMARRISEVLGKILE